MLSIRCLCSSKEGDADFSPCCVPTKISGKRPGLADIYAHIYIYICIYVFVYSASSLASLRCGLRPHLSVNSLLVGALFRLFFLFCFYFAPDIGHMNAGRAD